MADSSIRDRLAGGFELILGLMVERGYLRNMDRRFMVQRVLETIPFLDRSNLPVWPDAERLRLSVHFAARHLIAWLRHICMLAVQQKALLFVEDASFVKADLAMSRLDKVVLTHQVRLSVSKLDDDVRDNSWGCVVGAGNPPAHPHSHH